MAPSVELILFTKSNFLLGQERFAVMESWALTCSELLLDWYHFLFYSPQNSILTLFSKFNASLITSGNFEKNPKKFQMFVVPFLGHVNNV